MGPPAAVIEVAEITELLPLSRVISIMRVPLRELFGEARRTHDLYAGSDCT